MSLFLERALANLCAAAAAYLVAKNPEITDAAKRLGLEMKD